MYFIASLLSGQEGITTSDWSLHHVCSPLYICISPEELVMDSSIYEVPQNVSVAWCMYILHG